MKVSRFAFLSKVGVALIMAIMMMAFAACSQSPVSTETATVESPQVLMRSFDASMAFKGASLYVAQIISAEEGGTLELFDVTLFIPPGAVDEDTTFSINIPDVELFYNEFGTSGLVFNEPVTVVMSYRDADLTGLDESTIRMAYLNEATGTFEDIDCDVDTEEQVVIAQLYHFSAYGLISDEQ